MSDLVLSTHKNAGFSASKLNVSAAIWLYTKRRRSIYQIAKVYSVHNSTISRVLRSNGVPVLYNNKAKGEKNWNWKGGVTKHMVRFSRQYREWRKNVFERDNYTCQICEVRGGNLNADHIKPQSLFPELRFEPTNGRTLCVPCHRLTDTYGEKCKILTRESFTR